VKPLLGLLAVAFIVSAAPARAQNCGKPVRVEQRTYREFDEKLFVYVGDIRTSSSGGWAAFAVRALVGSYRRPFLASSGVLMEAGLDQLLSQRRDSNKSGCSCRHSILLGQEPKTSENRCS
jgi:hypothetical protein